MNITIKTKNYKLDADTENVVYERLKVVKKLLAGDASTSLAEVELEVVEKGKNDNNIYRVEVNLQSEGKLYRSETTSRSFAKALGSVKQELKKEITRAKGKKHSLHKKGGRALKSLLRGLHR